MTLRVLDLKLAAVLPATEAEKLEILLALLMLRSISSSKLNLAVTLAPAVPDSPVQGALFCVCLQHGSKN